MRIVILAALFCGCDDLVCGPGTVRSGTTCVTGTPVPACADGGVVIGGNCYGDPTLLCGPDTKWDPTLRQCVGGPTSSCAAHCSSPNSQTVCVSGEVVSFLSPTTKATPQTGVKVRAYNPLDFVTSQQPTILGETTIDDNGCYSIDGISRGSLTQGLVAVSVTDVGSPTGGTFAVMGVGAILQPSRNVSNLQAYYLERQTVDAWETRVGATLYSAGIWMGWYLDAAGNAVAGVTPGRVGDDPPSTSIYCFRGDRMTLSTEDTTDATGLCIISPDSVETHTGRCGTGACTPPFPQSIGGTAPNVVFFQIFQQM